MLEIFHKLAGLSLDFGRRSLNLPNEFTISKSLEPILGSRVLIELRKQIFKLRLKFVDELNSFL